MRRFFFLVLGVALAGTQSGCVNRVLARKLVEAPNQRALPKDLQAMDITRIFAEKDPKFEQMFWQDSPTLKNHRISVGSPAVELAVITLEPGDHAATNEMTVTRERGY
ncbi:MAG: hypothetical protein ABIO94_04315, partial [Opitutaceae bacterium]